MYQYKAKVVSVYDADTVTLDIDLGCFTWLHDEKCRLYGINAPEVRGVERPEGIVARDALRKLIEGKEITIDTYKDKTGKYGRLLVDLIYTNDNGDQWSINNWLIEKGYAVAADY